MTKGGVRKGAGRPIKYGCKMVNMWVPELIVDKIKAMMKKLENVNGSK